MIRPDMETLHVEPPPPPRLAWWAWVLIYAAAMLACGLAGHLIGRAMVGAYDAAAGATEPALNEAAE